MKTNKINCLEKRGISGFLLAVASMAFSFVSFAQTTVRGVVSDETGNPVPGAGIIVQNTHTGTTSDINGHFSLTVPKGGKVLEFSSLGYSTKEVDINGQTVFNITLSENSDYLDEVVVVGYGTQKKVHMTGSVSAVSKTELAKVTVSNVSQSLVGKLPGLITQQSTGQPGADQVSILVRGYSSFNDAGTVLVLVDGIERNMNQVNPADIESISVLKDAASCAVYGMKGANGVILVTTKSGEQGAPKISYSGRLTLSHATALPKMMTGTQYMKYYNLGTMLDQIVAGKAENEAVPYFTEAEIAATTNGDLSDGIENTDWTSPMFKTTIMHQHNLSVSGGNNKVKYFISGGYQDQDGLIKGLNNKRTNVRSNVEVTPAKNLTVALNLGGMVQDFYQPGTLTFANGVTGGTVPFCLLYALPFVPKTYEMDDYPEYKGMPTSAMRTRDAFVANAEYGAKEGGYSESKTLQLETLARVEYAFPFVQGLKAGFSYSWDYRNIGSKTFAKAYDVMAWSFSERNYELRKCSYALERGNLNKGEQKYYQTVLRPQISYSRKFGKHDVSVLFLYEQNKVNSELLTAGRQNFDLFDIQELSFGDATTATNSGSIGRSAYAGFVGRINYAYADKYLVEFSGRYDGSYKFAKDHRWGFFPSFSAGWVISNENFFKNTVPAVDFLKIRFSVGEVGNDNVSAWQFRKSYAFSGNSVAFGQVAQNTIYNAVSYPQDDLTWERIRTTDVGFELKAWKGLLEMEFDWFYKYTYDILNTVTAGFPMSLGGHYPTYENSGAFDNRGFELSLKHSHRIGSFNYRVSGNVSYAHNKVLKRTQADNVLPWQDIIGHSWGAVWGLKTDGLYQTQEEVDNAPAGVDPKIGDIKYVDYNGDGKINSDDAVLIAKNSRPELMYAFQLDFFWKGFDFSLQFQGAGLCDKMLLGRWANGISDANPLVKPWYANYDNAPLYLVEQSWRPDNTNAKYPRLSVNGSSYRNNYRVSDFWLRNSAYLRLKNLTIGYTLPKKYTSKVGISSARIFANASNLLTFTSFKYQDPESPSALTAYYPQQRTVSFGVDLEF